MESNPLRIFLAGEQGAEDNIKFFKELVGDKEFPEQGSRESVRESNWTDKRSVQLVRIPEYSQHATEAAIRSLIEEVRVDVQTIILEGQLRKYKLQTEQQKSPLVGPPPKEDIVNICFYLVAPNRFKHLDIMFIKALSKRVTVVVLVNGISSKTDPEICASIAKRLELDEVITFQLCNPEQPPSLLVPEKKSDTRLLPHVFLLTDEAQAKFPSLTPSDISKAFLNLSPQKIEDFLKKANEQLDKAHATRISPFTKAQKRERVTKVTIGKRNVDVFTNLVTIKPETLEKLTTFSAFTNWIQRIANDPTVLIESIRVKSLDVFTSKNGFVEIEVFYTIEGDPKQRREEIFLRGGAISILIVLNCEGEEYTLVTKTARTPTGRDYLVEIPAGMIQDDGSVGGANFKVIINKTGLEMKQNELINLTGERTQLCAVVVRFVLIVCLLCVSELPVCAASFLRKTPEFCAVSLTISIVPLSLFRFQPRRLAKSIPVSSPSQKLATRKLLYISAVLMCNAQKISRSSWPERPQLSKSNPNQSWIEPPLPSQTVSS
eukprot:c11506_g1_i1.p1 GENE.c11506_g1_i1~~c11506_g1_i1.p1  ORF type:complete len:561 (+),score=107.70 c11506_g1_i1:45-1685(+)